MRVLIAKSQFIHDGEEYVPGDPIRFSTGNNVEPVNDPERFLEYNLAVEPNPEYHPKVTTAPGTDRLIIHRGGGWYDVIEPGGTLVEGKKQGHGAALDAAKTDEPPDDGETPDDDQ